MNDSKKHDDHDEPKQAVAAIFETREEAKQALGALHKAHFLKSWFGVTSVATDSHGDETLTAESASGFFSPSSTGLVDALVAHGIAGDVARTIESEIEAGEALVTVETERRDPAEAITILERFGGRTEISAPRGSAPRTNGASNERVDSVYEDVDLPVFEEEVFYTRRR